MVYHAEIAEIVGARKGFFFWKGKLSHPAEIVSPNRLTSLI